MLILQNIRDTERRERFAKADMAKITRLIAHEGENSIIYADTLCNTQAAAISGISYVTKEERRYVIGAVIYPVEGNLAAILQALRNNPTPPKHTLIFTDSQETVTELQTLPFTTQRAQAIQKEFKKEVMDGTQVVIS